MNDEVQFRRRPANQSGSNATEQQAETARLTSHIHSGNGEEWLLHRVQMPEWARNGVIMRGYRPIQPSVWYCVRTIFSLHNESGNIWTHLGGAVMFLALLAHLHCCTDLYPRLGAIDRFLVHVFFAGLLTCLMLSAAMHTFSCHSEELLRILAKLDYCGITLLIGCSFVPWMYYAWFNSPVWRVVYITMSIAFAVGCIFVSLCDSFGHPEFQKWRAILFLGDGLSAIIPGIHWVCRETWHVGGCGFVAENHLPGILLVVMGATYTLGGLLYLFRVPEHWVPGGIFDLWFHSHQLFHVLVLAGGLLYYHSITQLIELRLDDPNHYYN